MRWKLIVFISIVISGCGDSNEFKHDSNSIIGNWKLTELKYKGAVIFCSSKSSAQAPLPNLFDVEFNSTKCIFTALCNRETYYPSCLCITEIKIGDTTEADWIISGSTLSVGTLVSGVLVGSTAQGEISSNNIDELIWNRSAPDLEWIYTFKRIK